MRKALLLQTLLREWAYGQPYFSSKLRTAALRPWLRYYDEHGPTASTPCRAHQPPTERRVNNLLRQHSQSPSAPRLAHRRSITISPLFKIAQTRRQARSGDQLGTRRVVVPHTWSECMCRVGLAAPLNYAPQP